LRDPDGPQYTYKGVPPRPAIEVVTTGPALIRSWPSFVNIVTFLHQNKIFLKKLQKTAGRRACFFATRQSLSSQTAKEVEGNNSSKKVAFSPQPNNLFRKCTTTTSYIELTFLASAAAS
jgi:hypothetical protein